MRYQPLLVLMYECIVRGVFDYDYAPASAMVHGKRIYMNVTQEGRDHLEDLVEAAASFVTRNARQFRVRRSGVFINCSTVFSDYKCVLIGAAC